MAGGTKESIEVHADASAVDMVPPRPGEDQGGRGQGRSSRRRRSPTRCPRSGSSGSPEAQCSSRNGRASQFDVVNSVDVTDPATGEFGRPSLSTLLKASITSRLRFSRSWPFLLGVVSWNEAWREKWKWELNDPLPEFNIRSWHLHGLRTATPRLNVEGPILPGSSTSPKGSIMKCGSMPFGTHFPFNQKKTAGFNSFTQIDWIASARNLLTGSVHMAPQRLQFVNLNYYNPQPTTPDANTSNYTATVPTSGVSGRGLGEYGLGDQIPRQRLAKRRCGLRNPAPNRCRELLRATASQCQTRELVVVICICGKERLGNPQLEGRSLPLPQRGGRTDDGTSGRHRKHRRPSLGEDCLPGWRAIPQPRYRSRHLRPGPLDSESAPVVGSRIAHRDSNHFGNARFAPRGGIAWSPFRRTGTVVRAGAGVFYDRVPLGVYSFDRYPERVVTFYDAAGAISAGPFTYINGLGEVVSHRSLTYSHDFPGNFAPRSTTGSVQIEQPLTRNIQLRIGYLHAVSSSLVILDATGIDPVTNTGRMLLSGGGTGRYRQFDVTAKVRRGEGRELFFSYVRSRTTGI